MTSPSESERGMEQREALEVLQRFHATCIEIIDELEALEAGGESNEKERYRQVLQKVVAEKRFPLVFNRYLIDVLWSEMFALFKKLIASRKILAELALPTPSKTPQ